MNTEKVRAAVLAVIFCAAAGLGLSACDSGTEAGDTHKEDSGIVDTEQTIKQSRRDTTDYEHHYDHDEGTAIGDGAYNQDGKRDKRP